jgi:hypothetical protein
MSLQCFHAKSVIYKIIKIYQLEILMIKNLIKN